MGNLRHIDMSVPDPPKTAEFCKYAFGMDVIDKTDSICDGSQHGWGGAQKAPGGAAAMPTSARK